MRRRRLAWRTDPMTARFARAVDEQCQRRNRSDGNGVRRWLADSESNRRAGDDTAHDCELLDTVDMPSPFGQGALF